MARGVLGGVVAMTDDTHSHFVRAWVSRHDNEWEAWVGEDEHGDFHAWACQSGAATVKRDAVEDTETHGKGCGAPRDRTKNGPPLQPELQRLAASHEK